MTERTVAKQSRMEDDAISITSTQETEYPEDFGFEVDRILAERMMDGKKRYLISWLNYPEERSTWEPRANIQDPAIVDLWKERKMRETSGIDPPFDLANFNARASKLAEEKAHRRRMRKAKRRRSGIPVSPSGSENQQSDDSDSSVEAMEEDDEPEDHSGLRRGRKKKSRAPPNKAKKPFKVLVTGGNVQQLDNSSSGVDANTNIRWKKKSNSRTRASPEPARPVPTKPLEVLASHLQTRTPPATRFIWNII
jgi:chromo domain-containing protein 1